MITFRFYLVSLVAVFLSIALGVTIGSTFLQPALVTDLNNQVESVRRSLDDRVERIDTLGAEIRDLESFREQAAAWAVAGTLTDSATLVVAEEGTDVEAVERLVGRLRQADAVVDGIVWIDPTWGSGDETPTVLQALGLGPVPTRDRDAVRNAVWTEVVEVLAPTATANAVEPGDAGSDDREAPEPQPGATDPQPAPTNTPADTDGAPNAPALDGADDGASEASPPPPPGPGPDPQAEPDALPSLLELPAFDVLEDVGWIRRQVIEAGDRPEAGTRATTVGGVGVVLVTSPRIDAEERITGIMDMARVLAVADVATVVAEAWSEREDPDGQPAPRGLALAGVRDDPELELLVSTVDALDQVDGQVATVLALVQRHQGVAGHYGFGRGAERVLPAWPVP